MSKMLLGLAGAVAVLTTAPALADGFGGSGNGGNANGFVIGGGSFGDRQSDRRHRNNGEIGTWINGGEWARYNNRPFDPDGFNGWWHDRPDRAYPAWMRNNQDCAKPWFQGSTLRC